MVTRLLDPSAGRILFEGADIGSIPARQFASAPARAAIQIVFQDPTESLNPRWPAFDCIADPIRRLGSKEDRAVIAGRVAELAAQVGLPADLLTRYPHQLSGGQKARVGIARAIALRPRLLILDEPTSALDVSVQAVVLRLLDRLRRELGMAYLFVSHDLNVVRLLCSRVLVMNQGRIVEEGPSEVLLSNPRAPNTRALIEAVPQLQAAPPRPMLPACGA
jgi:peptide/nickel transport system ATP-binding protein